MPIYEYECSNGHSFELLQKIGEKGPITCIHCNSKVKKLISQSSFQLKGSGWYVTDYAKTNKEKSTSACDTPAACETKCKNENVA